MKPEAVPPLLATLNQNRNALIFARLLMYPSLIFGAALLFDCAQLFSGYELIFGFLLMVGAFNMRRAAGKMQRAYRAQQIKAEALLAQHAPVSATFRILLIQQNRAYGIVTLPSESHVVVMDITGFPASVDAAYPVGCVVDPHRAFLLVVFRERLYFAECLSREGVERMIEDARPEDPNAPSLKTVLAVIVVTTMLIMLIMVLPERGLYHRQFAPLTALFFLIAGLSIPSAILPLPYAERIFELSTG